MEPGSGTTQIDEPTATAPSNGGASAAAASNESPATATTGNVKGTLADPEVYENVPGHIIPILQREYEDFKTERGMFLAGETPEDEFIKFRLKQGVYGQRQPDVQMIRVKLPFGGVAPEQLDAF